MNDESIEIRGYAIPFARTRHIVAAGVVELIEPDAFDRMLCTTAAVPLLWQSHDLGAPPIAMARLHVDEYGLAFSASLSANKNWPVAAAMTRHNAPVDQASVGLISEDKTIGRYGTSRLHLVRRASIDHVSIVDSAIYGDLTAVWPMHCDLGNAPYRIQCLAADWEVGRAAWNARPRQPVARAAPAQPRAATAKSAKVLATSRYDEVRRQFASAIMAGKMKTGVFGHAAFSRGGGYDGNFRALLARARTAD